MIGVCLSGVPKREVNAERCWSRVGQRHQWIKRSHDGSTLASSPLQQVGRGGTYLPIDCYAEPPEAHPYYTSVQHQYGEKAVT